MHRASYFYENKALFGSFPTQRGVEELEQEGVILFVDLTMPGETLITPYETKEKYIRYPIVDRKSPTNVQTFSTLIVRLADIISQLKDGEKIYIHCKGGHGRAGVVVACLLCRLHNITASEALILTRAYHNNRPEMSSRMRKMGSPQTNTQKSFVNTLYNPARFSGGPLALSDPSSIIYKSEVYPDAYQALSQHPGHLKPIIVAKMEQNPDVREILLQTGLGPIIYLSNNDSLLGDLGDGRGHNALGVIWQRLRDKLYKN